MYYILLYEIYCLSQEYNVITQNCYSIKVTSKQSTNILTFKCLTIFEITFVLSAITRVQCLHFDLTLSSVLAGISKCFKTAAIMVTQCKYNKSEWFVNPPVTVLILLSQDSGQ